MSMQVWMWRKASEDMISLVWCAWPRHFTPCMFNVMTDQRPLLITMIPGAESALNHKIHVCELITQVKLKAIKSLEYEWMSVDCKVRIHDSIVKPLGKSSKCCDKFSKLSSSSLSPYEHLCVLMIRYFLNTKQTPEFLSNQFPTILY